MEYEEITKSLLHWYDYNARILPWRESRDPYAIWVSEIMLQQTRVEAVKPYFDRFMERLPKAADLANVSEDELMKLWEGLGYYNRARNLQAAAKTLICEFGGSLPADYEKLLSLKGIGVYTAGAIASIAFNIPVPAVDGNVLRVMTRLFGDFSDIMKESTKKAMSQKIKDYIPLDRPGDFNQALIELGAVVCVPNGAPHCEDCPWDTVCVANKNDLTDQLPVKTPKKPRRIEHKTVFLLESGDQIAIHKRNKKGLLAGLWEFPNVQGKCSMEEVEQVLEQWGAKDYIYETTHGGKHIFTHIEWQMSGIRVQMKKADQLKNFKWIGKAELETHYAIPSAFEIFKNQI